MRAPNGPHRDIRPDSCAWISTLSDGFLQVVGFEVTEGNRPQAGQPSRRQNTSVTPERYFRSGLRSCRRRALTRHKALVNGRLAVHELYSVTAPEGVVCIGLSHRSGLLGRDDLVDAGFGPGWFGDGPVLVDHDLFIGDGPVMVVSSLVSSMPGGSPAVSS